MHSIHMAVEEFNTLVIGSYPGDIDTRVNQVDPTIPGNIGDMSLAAGVRVPPFPANALLRPHPGLGRYALRHAFGWRHDSVKDISHSFDTLKSAAQSEIKA
jgi:hypothetical protein